MIHAKQKEKLKGRKEMDFWLIAYIVVSIIIGTGASGFLYKRQQTVAAILTFILLLLIFIFYGLRWFSGGNLKGSQPGTVAWPPIVNACPDFMISYKASDGKTYCYDVNNFYGLKVSTTSISNVSNTNLTYGALTGQNGYVILNPTATTTDLKGDKAATAGSRKWPLLTQFAVDPSSVVNADVNNRYMRWEGVWDGRNATPEKLQPLPS
jgi:hypothetical protein